MMPVHSDAHGGWPIRRLIDRMSGAFQGTHNMCGQLRFIFYKQNIHDEVIASGLGTARKWADGNGLLGIAKAYRDSCQIRRITIGWCPVKANFSGGRRSPGFLH
jgi:hypothetical protein